jgi:hypothetical protein
MMTWKRKKTFYCKCTKRIVFQMSIWNKKLLWRR